jgi:hypothetical protein
MKPKTLLVLTFLLVSTALEAASPFSRAAGGKWVHKFSGVILPLRIAMFQRADTQLFDRAGRDVRIRYYLDQLILGDVYVYPVERDRPDLKTEFATQQKAIRDLNKKVKLISQENIRTTQNGHVVAGLHANYELQRDLFNRNEKCESQLFVFRDGAWFVAYRFSYPRSRSPVARQHITEFLSQFRWKEH